MFGLIFGVWLTSGAARRRATLKASRVHVEMCCIAVYTLEYTLRHSYLLTCTAREMAKLDGPLDVFLDELAGRAATRGRRRSRSGDGANEHPVRALAARRACTGPGHCSPLALGTDTGRVRTAVRYSYRLSRLAALPATEITRDALAPMDTRPRRHRHS